MSVDTKTPQLIINQLTEEQYANVVDPSSNQIWLTPDNTQLLLDGKQDKLLAGTDLKIIPNGPEVPGGYEQLEYIQGLNNTQYINTGIVPTKDMTIYAKFGIVSISGSNTNGSPFGVRHTSGGDDGVTFFTGAGSNTRVDYGWFGDTASTYRWRLDTATNAGDIFEVEMQYCVGRVTKNGILLGTHEFNPISTCDIPIFLNGLNNAGTAFTSHTSTTFRQYRFRIAGICDMIPAKRLSDGAVGMYDSIRREFFHNAGTGSFTAGPSVGINLPHGYTPIEYLESSWTQYIDTGFKPTNKTRIVAEIYGTDTTYGSWIYGSRTSGSSSDFFGFIEFVQSNADKYRTDYYNTATIASFTDSMIGKKLVIDKNRNVTTCYLDGVSVGSTTHTAGTFTCAYNLYLFSLNHGGTPAINGSKSRIYSCKIYDNDILVRDFIPALDGNLEPCMYDLVNDVTYYNEGTGDFIQGPKYSGGAIISFTNESGYIKETEVDYKLTKKQDKLIAGTDIEIISSEIPGYYEELEYIEGIAQQQYIDTNVVPTPSMSIYGKFQFVEQIDSGNYATYFFGERIENVGGKGVFAQVSPTDILLDYFGSTGTHRYSITNTRSELDMYEFSIVNNVATITKNSTQVGTHTFTIREAPGQLPIYLNAYNGAGSVTEYYHTRNRVYRFIVEGICDMHPARRKSDGVLGMYDTIRKTFFTNAGTGSFTAGPVIPALPIGYTKVEYLESTGTQYIDTGIVYSDVLNARIELDAIMRDIGVRGIGRSGSYFGGPFVGLQSGGKFGYSAGDGDQVSTVDGMSDVRYKYDLNIPANSYTVKDENGNTLVNLTSLTKATRSETPACILFGYYGNPNTGDGPNKLRPMRIYSCKMYDNGALVRDFIPALDSEGVACMYDMVTGSTFYNAGTGAFTVGPRIESYGTVINFVNNSGFITAADLPTVNNATLTITQGGTTKGTFTANASENVTIELDEGGGSSVDIDNSTITTNADDEIQAVAVIDQNTGIAKTWTGTKAEYEAIVTKDPETEYIITDDIGGPATEIGEITEALNDKVDKGHQVVEFQAPTAENNYTWYRKYADGWVEQGGIKPVSDGTAITFAVIMADTNYWYTAKGFYNNTTGSYSSSHDYVLTKSITGMTLSTGGLDVSWEVKGMAA